MSRSDAFDKMWELLRRDHGGCDNPECSLGRNIAKSSRYALTIWATSGASDSEFNKLYEKYFKPKAKKRVKS